MRGLPPELLEAQNAPDMIECIPCFSEGRRSDVIEAIAQSIRAIQGVYLLDVHIDAVSNRSQITFAGTSEAVAEAAFRAVESATLLIDMGKHAGSYPRIGAVDTMPFVPLRGTSMAQCIAVARAVASRIGLALDIPVFTYGAAALNAERRELALVRRGEYEGLRESIGHDPQQRPDFGPSRVGTAGAVAIGARSPQIAYNISLNTDNLEIAQQIARAVRGSTGGLRGVQAIGLLVGGRAQVSMNLTDYQNTPVHRAVEMVAREAGLYGISVASGELVGLIPEDALIDAGKASLRLPGLSDAQILERRLAVAISTNNERRSAKTLRSRLSARREERARTQAPANPSAGRIDEAVWTYSIEALVGTVDELARTASGGRVQSMLRVLGRDLMDLAEEERRAELQERVQTLLLIARRAVKATEALTTSGAAQWPQAASMVHLVYSVTALARLRALALLPLLAENKQEPLAYELAIYTQRARDLLARIDPVA